MKKRVRESVHPIDRFYMEVHLSDGCWEWTGTKNQQGYGLFHYQRIFGGDWFHVSAHRYSYEYENGPIPEGLHLDHLCLNPQCVRPDHLEAVTPRENIMRGQLGERSRTGRCLNGHDVTLPGATYPGGRCALCSNANCVEYYQRNKEQILERRRLRRQKQSA